LSRMALRQIDALKLMLRLYYMDEELL